MPILQILKMGHPILRKKSLKVTNFSKAKEIAESMKETLKYIGASGLAAPQVMINQRIIVYRINKERIPKKGQFTTRPWTYMINPIIKPIGSKKEMFWERCLSIPGLHGKVPRYKKIFVKYYTLEKKIIEHEAHSTWAALLQHEYDHLNGILYPMRMKDFTYFGYNDTPGDIAKDTIKNKKAIDPLFLELVKKWPYKKFN